MTSTVVIESDLSRLAIFRRRTRLYVSGAEEECVYVYDHRKGYLTLRERIQLTSVKDKNVIAGLTEYDSGKKLIACGS